MRGIVDSLARSLAPAPAERAYIDAVHLARPADRPPSPPRATLPQCAAYIYIYRNLPSVSCVYMYLSLSLYSPDVVYGMA